MGLLGMAARWPTYTYKKWLLMSRLAFAPQSPTSGLVMYRARYHALRGGDSAVWIARRGVGARFKSIAVISQE